MQHLSSRVRTRGKLVFFVPRWLCDDRSPSGLPYRIVPVLSSLTANGFDVTLIFERLDGIPKELPQLLQGCTAAVAWCSELNPAVQVPGMLGFLNSVRAADDSIPRIAGGGFLPLVPPPRIDLSPLATATILSEEVDALSRHLLGETGERPRAKFDVDAMRHLDLEPFLREESLLFCNDAPSLQIPTAMGCGKRCTFCFWEPGNWRALPANEIVDMIAFTHERYGVKQFLFGELDFLAGPTRVRDVARGIIERKLDIRWFALGSVQDLLKLDDADMEMLVASGCHTLELGLEAGSDSALQKLGKLFRAEQAMQAHRRLVRYGILPVYNFVFGWPGQTRAEERATRRLIDEIHRTAPLVRLHFRLYQAVPSTTMGEQVFDYLPKLPKTIDELLAFREDESRRLPWLAEKEERRVRFLTEHVLPLAYSDTLQNGERSRTRATLSRIARWRTRTGFLRLPVDRQLFERTATVGLPDTYLP